jgi:hypothetical protein
LIKHTKTEYGSKKSVFKNTVLGGYRALFEQKTDKQTFFEKKAMKDKRKKNKIKFFFDQKQKTEKKSVCLFLRRFLMKNAVLGGYRALFKNRLPK